MSQWNQSARQGQGYGPRGGGGPRPGGGPPGQPRPTQGGPGAPAERVQVDAREVRRIVEEDDARGMVQLAERYGKALVDNRLATAQIRGIFSAVRGMEGRWLSEETRRGAARELQLLRPKLAYQAARNRPVELLSDMLVPALDAVGNDEQRFRRFVDYFEALLAYHKAAGGRD